MSLNGDCPLAAILAQRLRDEREDIVGRWLERIADRVTLDPLQIFPTQDILDHVPLLVDGIAAYLEDPGEEITADIPVVAKAMELGEMRHAQGFDVYQILKEYEILGGVLFDFLSRTVESVEEPCTRSELLVCGHRIFRSVVVIQQFTTTQYLRLADERVREREKRLSGFNRAVTHELKNRIGVALGASAMLREEHVAADVDARAKFLGIVTSNVAGMNATLDQLTELSRLEAGPTRVRNILLSDAAAEVKRQLREFAESRGVLVEIAADLPEVEIPAAAVELALSNYMSNAIKYHDRAEAVPRVWVEAELVTHEETGPELHVRVIDNGLGVPLAARGRLFRRYFRAHGETVTEEEGTGLGLSLVRDTVDSLGGRAWAEFPGKGSRFLFSIPYSDDPSRHDAASKPRPGAEAAQADASTASAARGAEAGEARSEGPP